MNDIVTVITPTQHTDELIIIYGIISIPIIFLVIVFFVYLGRISDAIHKQTHHETDYNH